MKKISIVALFICTLVLLSSCGAVKECDLCSNKGADNILEVGDSTYQLCSSCYGEYYMLDNDNISNYDYGSSYDSYDSNSTYDSYDNSYSYGSNNCSDCGTTIPSDRIYCDSCLGFGVCQDCGTSIDSDRLYCDSCLGFGVCQDCGISVDSDRLYCDSCLGFGTCQDCGRSISSDRLYCDTCLYN